MTDIIIVTGSPGTGKSALSGRLANLLDCKPLESSELLRSGGALRRDPSGRDAEIIVEDVALKVIRSLTESGGCYVVSTLHPTLWLEAVGDSIVFIILLRCHPVTLMGRLESRGWGRVKVLENVIAEALNVIAEELLEYEDSVLEIDTTNLTVEGVVDVVLSKLGSWDTGVRIDWLSLDDTLVEFVTKLVHELDLYKERLGV